MIRRLVLLCGFCALLLAPAPPAAAADDPPKPGAATPAIDLSPHAGKVVYVDFWASWCVPCKKSFPWMMGLLQRHGEEGLVILTVNVDSERKSADAFIENMKSTLPVIYDPEGKLAAEYALEAMPSSFVYGRDGTLRGSHLGFRMEDTDKIEAELQKLLAEKVPTNEETHEAGH
jgi:thiol-disulfide isomerase/thioredoxin